MRKALMCAFAASLALTFIDGARAENIAITGGKLVTVSDAGTIERGTILIENGRIAHPVTNFRWNDSPISVLKNIEEMSAAVRAEPRGGASGTIVVPALRVSSFEFSSVSEAV